MSHKTLLQKVMYSCKLLYLWGNNEFDNIDIANSFLNVAWFTCKEKNVLRAIDRRMFELVCIGLVESKGKKWSLVYSLTEYGKRIDTDRIHLWVTLVIRDNKECDVCKKVSPDKIRKSSENTNVKSENKVLNTVIDWNVIKVDISNWLACDHYSLPSEVVFPLDRNTEILNTNKGTPKHSIAEHIKERAISLFN